MAILTNSNDSVRADSGRTATWQTEMKNAIRDLSTLNRRLGLPNELGQNVAVTPEFPVFVPEPYLSRIEPGNPADPLLLQVLPGPDENVPKAGFSRDPLHEKSAALTPGLLQKYSGRVLMVVTGACAVHCRYCFRRHFPYQETPTSVQQWMPALREIQADLSIKEVLLSGGDPLTLVDEKIADLVSQLEEIPHLKRLRIHTRLPVVIPSRLTDKLLQTLTGSRLQPVVVIHANHPNEIDTEVQTHLRRLRQSGITLLNQSVLLRRINDNADALIGLSERLLDCSVLPYYLHQLDPVEGAAHFQVPIETGIELIQKMRAALPGYAVPRYVQELPGKPNKTVLA